MEDQRRGYFILEQQTTKELEKEVNQFLKAGFRLVGQPFMIYAEKRNETYYYQAVIRD